MAWIMTSFGILMPAIRPPKTVPAGDDRTLQIRTRREQELTILRAQYMRRTLGSTIATPNMDYEFRAYCTPEAFGLAMAQLMVEIDYTKFKPTVKERYHDMELYDTYNSIWAVVSGRLSTWEHQRHYWHGRRPYTPTHASRVVDLVGADNYLGDPTAGWSDRPDALDGWDWRAAVDTESWEVAALGTGEDTTDAKDLHAEIDRILDEQYTPMDHVMCDHPQSNNARRRCLRRRRRELASRLEVLRARLDACTDEQATVAALAG